MMSASFTNVNDVNDVNAVRIRILGTFSILMWGIMLISVSHGYVLCVYIYCIRVSSVSICHVCSLFGVSCRGDSETSFIGRIMEKMQQLSMLWQPLIIASESPWADCSAILFVANLNNNQIYIIIIIIINIMEMV